MWEKRIQSLQKNSETATRRSVLSVLGGGMTAALAGCSSAGTSSDNTPTEQISNKQPPSLFAATLIPTIVVRLSSSENVWQPRLVRVGPNDRAGWQIAAGLNETTTDNVTSYDIPSHVLLSGMVSREELPSSVQITNRHTDTRITPDRRGRHEFDLAVERRDPTDSTRPNFYLATNAGRVGMTVTLAEDSQLADLGRTDSDSTEYTARAPSRTGVGQGDDVSVVGYPAPITPQREFADALAEGARDLQQLMTYTTIVYGAGFAAIRGTSGVLLDFVLGAADAVYEEARSQAIERGIMQIALAVTGSGEQIRDVPNRIGEARIVQGAVVFPPTTEAQRTVVEPNDIRQGAGYGYEDHSADSGQIEEIGLGFSGPFIHIRTEGNTSPDERPPTTTREASACRSSISVDFELSSYSFKYDIGAADRVSGTIEHANSVGHDERGSLRMTGAEGKIATAGIEEFDGEIELNYAIRMDSQDEWVGAHFVYNDHIFKHSFRYNKISVRDRSGQQVTTVESVESVPFESRTWYTGRIQITNSGIFWKFNNDQCKLTSSKNVTSQEPTMLQVTGFVPQSTDNVYFDDLIVKRISTG